MIQRGADNNMPAARRKGKSLLCVTLLNLCICLLLFVSWNLKNDDRKKIRIPSVRFWQKPTLSKSFWNQQQQRLDFVFNPNFNPVHSNKSRVVLPDWLSDTSGPLNPCEPDYSVQTQISDYNLIPQSFKDFVLHVRCRSYPMLINQPDICDKKKPFLLLVVKSLIQHFDRRQAIRETWGRAGVVANRTVATVFLLGNTAPEDHFPDLQQMLHHEANLHRDLLQWDFRDTFFNLTLKDVLFLGWFSRNCPHARYVLKGDDDVFVNTFRIIDLLEGLSEKQREDLFIGDVITDAGPHRDPDLKYFIPESVFEGGYPPYAGGGGYLYSGELALRIYNVSREVVLYPIDDVYTGMCLQKLGLVPEGHNGFKTFDIEEHLRFNPCVYRSLILVHSRTPHEMLKIWPWIVQPELDCQ